MKLEKEKDNLLVIVYLMFAIPFIIVIAFKLGKCLNEAK